ncbi:glycosyltransferase family 4 protein [Halobacteriales archaeon Cl-PHB]
MRVSHYFEWEEYITGGQHQSVQNQRTMLEAHGIDYTTRPDLSADIIHFNNMGPRSLYYAKRAQCRGIPVVAHTHQTAEDFEESFALSNQLAKPMRPYLEWAYAQADQLVCPSEYTEGVIEDYCDTPTTVISNGFDPAKVEGHEDLREEYLDRYDLAPPVVFMVGHVIERKGLRAWVETARQFPEVDFAWFGYLNPGGGTVDRIFRSRTTTKLVKAAPENCTFTGYIEDIRGAFAAGDVFFWPSKNENEGMALLEAMAAEKPVVIRDIPVYDWLEDGENCLKADENFLDPIETLVDDPDRRTELGRAASETSEDYTIDAIGDQLVDLYRSVV